MPLRAFIDSYLLGARLLVVRRGTVLMPLRAFIDSYGLPTPRDGVVYIGLNALAGIH